jgi:hypothetical protein
MKEYKTNPFSNTNVTNNFLEFSFAVLVATVDTCSVQISKSVAKTKFAQVVLTSACPGFKF